MTRYSTVENDSGMKHRYLNDLLSTFIDLDLRVVNRSRLFCVCGSNYIKQKRSGVYGRNLHDLPSEYTDDQKYHLTDN